jgi:hypothetical protein
MSYQLAYEVNNKIRSDYRLGCHTNYLSFTTHCQAIVAGDKNFTSCLTRKQQFLALVAISSKGGA